MDRRTTGWSGPARGRPLSLSVSQTRSPNYLYPWLPVHPVAMKTTFRHCFLVNFAVEPGAMRAQLPAHLEPDLHAGRAYLSVVIADMVRMRPVFLPAALGVTYTQVVYRAVVRCGLERGVTFLRSDADNRFMVAAGNALTFFRFHHASATWSVSDDRVQFSLEPDSKVPAAITADFELVRPARSYPRHHDSPTWAPPVRF
jgi:hypothetical protein